jgi:hypothetical protein
MSYLMTIVVTCSNPDADNLARARHGGYTCLRRLPSFGDHFSPRPSGGASREVKSC